MLLKWNQPKWNEDPENQFTEDECYRRLEGFRAKELKKVLQAVGRQIKGDKPTIVKTLSSTRRLNRYPVLLEAVKRYVSLH